MGWAQSRLKPGEQNESGVRMKDDKDHKDCACKGGFTRRAFLTTVGIGAAAAAALPNLTCAEEQAAELPAGDVTKIMLKVNGVEHKLLVEPRWTLLFALREKLGLTGSKVGCERGECGACTVLIDDEPRYACLTLAVEAQGKTITTIEGLLNGEELGATQQAFLENDAFQCGYCTPGQIMAAEGLLRKYPNPTDEQIRHGMAGNLCRCGTYDHIFKAVARAAELKRGGKS